MIRVVSSVNSAASNIISVACGIIREVSDILYGVGGFKDAKVAVFFNNGGEIVVELKSTLAIQCNSVQFLTFTSILLPRQ